MVVVIDESIVFQFSDVNAACAMRAGADRLLIRLEHSGLATGIFCRTDPLQYKARVLEKLGVSMRLINSFSDPNNFSGNQCVFVCAEKDLDEFKSALGSSSWRFITLAEGHDSTLSLDSLPLTITSMIKKEVGSEITLVGHCMNWKREKDLLQRGALPFTSGPGGLCFAALDLSSSLEQQLSAVDIVLCKATDEIVSVSKATIDWINFSDRFMKLDRYLREHPEIRVVDPTERVTPLMDRVATQALLEELLPVRASGGAIVRPPRSLTVTGFDGSSLLDKLKSSNLPLPTIVKPQIACGASESHTMAIVFEERGYANLPVPLPAVIQEYVDHGSVIYKFYVLGEKVFHSTRRSTPDAAMLRVKLGNEEPAMVFDSLKSLPAGEVFEEQAAAAALDMSAMRTVAALLRQKLRLSMIGFDVVVHSETRDHVVVDVNYFPTFKDVPDAEAVPAFWKALEHN